MLDGHHHITILFWTGIPIKLHNVLSVPDMNVIFFLKRQAAELGAQVEFSVGSGA